MISVFFAIFCGAGLWLISLAVVGQIAHARGAAARPAPSWPSWTLEDYAPAEDPRRGTGRALWVGWCHWCGVALTTPIPSDTDGGHVHIFNSDVIGRRCAVALDGKWYCQACVTAVREVIEVAK